MAADRKKAENIITTCVVIFALVLSALVILVKTGVIGPEEDDTTTETTAPYVVETTLVVKSEVDENGDVSYYSIMEYYTKPGVSSNHRYPTTTKVTSATEESEDDMTYYIEKSEVVSVTDKDGNQVTDENGEAVTKVHKYTVPTDKNGKTTVTSSKETTTVTTSEKTTKIIYLTDPISKKPIKNLKGDYIVSGVETEPDDTTNAKQTTAKLTTIKIPTIKITTTKVTTTKDSSSEEELTTKPAETTVQ